MRLSGRLQHSRSSSNFRAIEQKRLSRMVGYEVLHYYQRPALSEGKLRGKLAKLLRVSNKVLSVESEFCNNVEHKGRSRTTSNAKSVCKRRRESLISRYSKRIALLSAKLSGKGVLRTPRRMFCDGSSRRRSTARCAKARARCAPGSRLAARDVANFSSKSVRDSTSARPSPLMRWPSARPWD